MTDKPNEETKDDAGTVKGEGSSTPAPIPDEASAPNAALTERVTHAATVEHQGEEDQSREPSGLTVVVQNVLALGRRVGRSPAVLTIALGVLVVLLALMLFLPGIMPVKLGAAKKAANAETEQEIEVIASRFAKNLLTFDYRTLKEDLARIARDATGTFEREFEGVSAVSGNVVDAEAVSKGEVQAVSVTSRSDDSSTALVFLRRTIENKSQPEPRTQFQFLELTLVNTPDGWKVDDVKDPTLAGL